MMDMATPAKPSAPKAITTKHLAYALAEQHQIAKKQSLEMVEELIGMITKHLKKGERVRIPGLGILQVRSRAARMGRNPATGEAIHIKASKKEGAIILSDLIGKLDVVRLTCEKCGRDGRYILARLIR